MTEEIDRLGRAIYLVTVVKRVVIVLILGLGAPLDDIAKIDECQDDDDGGSLNLDLSCCQRGHTRKHRNIHRRTNKH